MGYYSVLAVTPTTDDWIPDYIGPANALVAKHGGKYIARTASHERLEGEGEVAALQIAGRSNDVHSFRKETKPCKKPF